MPDQPVPLCFIDCETTGLHHERLPWDVAVIRREPDGACTEWQAFLDVDLSKADPFALKIGHFYERHPLGRWLSGRDGEVDDGVGVWHAFTETVCADVAAARFARMTHGAHIIGAVPNFDTSTMGDLARNNELLNAHHYHLIDVETLAVGFLAGRGEPIAPPWSSDDLSAALGVTPPGDDERHTALGDARWAQRLYDAVMSGGAA